MAVFSGVVSTAAVAPGFKMAIVIGEPVALFGVPRTVEAGEALALPVAAGELDVEVDVELELLLHPATVTARHAVTPRAWTGRNLGLDIPYRM
jgi:hypothetical protein